MRFPIALLIACLALPAVAADELPPFRTGLWEFKRSVDGGDGKPVTLTNQKCTNPTEDMRKKTVSMAQSGCQPSPVSKSGNLYTFSLKCTIQGVSLQSKSVITAESDSAYKVDAETKQGSKTTRELLTARRVGDCPEIQQ
jgi:Protein of unknown function (DUF3617)